MCIRDSRNTSCGWGFKTAVILFDCLLRGEPSAGLAVCGGFPLGRVGRRACDNAVPGHQCSADYGFAAAYFRDLPGHNPQNPVPLSDFKGHDPVSYTHLDVYKRQTEL